MELTAHHFNPTHTWKRSNRVEACSQPSYLPYAGLPAIGLGWNILMLLLAASVCRPLLASTGKSDMSSAGALSFAEREGRCVGIKWFAASLCISWEYHQYFYKLKFSSFVVVRASLAPKKVGRQPHFRLVIFMFFNKSWLGWHLRQMVGNLKLIHCYPSDTFLIFLISNTAYM